MTGSQSGCLDKRGIRELVDASVIKELER
jgi:hypothetical protein